MNTDSKQPDPVDSGKDETLATNHPNFEERLLKITQELGMRAWPRISRGLNSLPPGRAAHLIESGTPHQRTILWSLLNDRMEAEVAPLLSSDLRQDLLSKMNRKELQELVLLMDTDELVEIVGELPDRIAKDVLNSMDEERKQRVAEQLDWDKGTAGYMMTPDIPHLLANSSIYMAMQYIGDHAAQVKGIDTLAVVNRKNQYRGSVSLSALMGAQRTATVRSVLDEEAQVILATASTREVIEKLDGTSWDSLPVVDENNYLLGIIRRERAIEAALKAADELARRPTGTTDDTFAPLWHSTWRRASWLGANLFTAGLAAVVIYFFQETILQAVALAVLMPIVTSMGGVAATQTLAITIRAQALNQLRTTNINWLISREISVSLLCGILLAVPSILLVSGWSKEWTLAGLFGGAVLLNLIIGAIAGVVIPVLAERMRIDAAVSGAVIVTTVTDIAGFGIFLGFGTLLYL